MNSIIQRTSSLTSALGASKDIALGSMLATKGCSIYGWAAWQSAVGAATYSVTLRDSLGVATTIFSSNTNGNTVVVVRFSAIVGADGLCLITHGNAFTSLAVPKSRYGLNAAWNPNGATGAVLRIASTASAFTQIRLLECWFNHCPKTLS